MSYTKVAITSESYPHQRHALTAVLATSFGLIVGSVLTLPLSTPLLPHEYTLIATTGASQGSSSSKATVRTFESTPASPTPESYSPQTDSTDDNNEVIDSDFSVSQNEVIDINTEETSAIERTFIVNEIALMRSDLIAIMSEFDATCGAWSDPCATPYSERLAVHNSVYHDLVQTLESLP
jgi:hypothetical protein